MRHLVVDQAVPACCVGRRVLLSFREGDQYVRSVPTMATVNRTEAAPFVPQLDPAERARRRKDARDLLDSWETDGDEQEQRETLAVLREALGPDRPLSARSIFR
jgi:hypothetical protein